jgi:hypothetical protein
MGVEPGMGLLGLWRGKGMSVLNPGMGMPGLRKMRVTRGESSKIKGQRN